MEINSIIEHLSYLIGAFFISFILNKLVLRFSKSLGIRNKNDVVVRWSSTSKPSLGGISLFFTFLFSVLVFAGVSTDENIFDEIEFLGFLLAAVLAFAIGV